MFTTDWTDCFVQEPRRTSWSTCFHNSELSVSRVSTRFFNARLSAEVRSTTCVSDANVANAKRQSWECSCAERFNKPRPMMWLFYINIKTSIYILLYIISQSLYKQRYTQRVGFFITIPFNMCVKRAISAKTESLKRSLWWNRLSLRNLKLAATRILILWSLCVVFGKVHW